MTILRQNILTVLPLFIILGLLYCLVSYLLQMNEFNWSVDQEAESIGATIHEFVTDDFDLYFSKTTDGRLTITDQFERVIDRLSLQQDFLGITVFDQTMTPVYSRSAVDVLADRRIELEDLSSDEILSSDGFYTSYEELAGFSNDERPPYLHNLDLDRDTPVFSIYSYLYDAREDSSLSADQGAFTDEDRLAVNSANSFEHAFITVRKDASSYAAIRANISRWTIIEFLASILAGLIVSLALSFVLKKSVDDLHLKSGDIISGRNGSGDTDSNIHEFNELGHTMQMLVNVLGKNVEGYRKRIIENEQMRTPTEIASSFKKLSNPEFDDVHFQRHIRYGFINENAPGYFISHIHTPDEIVIITGSTEGQNPVETALDSDALSRILMRKLSESESVAEKRTSTGDVVKNIQELISSKELRLKIIRVLKSGEIIVDHFDGDGQDQSTFSNNHMEAVIVGYFPETLSNRINNYRRLVNGSYTDDLFDDIKTLSQGFQTGILVTISPLITKSTNEE